MRAKRIFFKSIGKRRWSISKFQMYTKCPVTRYHVWTRFLLSLISPRVLTRSGVLIRFGLGYQNPENSSVKWFSWKKRHFVVDLAKPRDVIVEWKYFCSFDTQFVKLLWPSAVMSSWSHHVLSSWIWSVKYGRIRWQLTGIALASCHRCFEPSKILSLASSHLKPISHLFSTRTNWRSRETNPRGDGSSIHDVTHTKHMTLIHLRDFYQYR